MKWVRKGILWRIFGLSSHTYIPEEIQRSWRPGEVAYNLDLPLSPQEWKITLCFIKQSKGSSSPSLVTLVLENKNYKNRYNITTQCRCKWTHAMLSLSCLNNNDLITDLCSVNIYLLRTTHFGTDVITMVWDLLHQLIRSFPHRYKTSMTQSVP